MGNRTVAAHACQIVRASSASTARNLSTRASRQRSRSITSINRWCSGGSCTFSIGYDAVTIATQAKSNALSIIIALNIPHHASAARSPHHPFRLRTTTEAQRRHCHAGGLQSQAPDAGWERSAVHEQVEFNLREFHHQLTHVDVWVGAFGECNPDLDFVQDRRLVTTLRRSPEREKSFRFQHLYQQAGLVRADVGQGCSPSLSSATIGRCMDDITVLFRCR